MPLGLTGKIGIGTAQKGKQIARRVFIQVRAKPDDEEKLTGPGYAARRRIVISIH